jgi:Bacterial mobilisation protein (MobC)
MKCTEVLKARVSPDIKLRVRALAGHELLKESAWLKRLVVRELQACDAGDVENRQSGSDERTTGSKPKPGASTGRSQALVVRLRRSDKLLLQARAEARGMRRATYASILLRSHLHGLSPLPKEELLALKRSISELAAIGRNINQLARVANETGRLPGSLSNEFRALLKICEALRDNTKALLKANVSSWSTGDAAADL